MPRRFDGAVWTIKMVEAAYLVRDEDENNKYLGLVLERAASRLKDCRNWLLKCRCPLEGGRLVPQPNCLRSTHPRSHGIVKGIAPWGALIRLRCEAEIGSGPTSAGVAPPRYGELRYLTRDFVRYLTTPPKDPDPRQWIPWTPRVTART